MYKDPRQSSPGYTRRFNAPLGVTLPFTDQIARAHAEERALGFRGDGLGEIALAGTRWSIEQDSAPWRPLSSEKMRKFDG